MATRKGRSMVSEDDSWRAQSDADTLARAQEIMTDRKRLTAAQRSAREQVTKLDRVVKCAPSTAQRSTTSKGRK